MYVLNFFRKKSEKTPEREIKKAERLVKKLLEK
ncbi:MAG: type II toxin-antitoxin system RelE/ParE family toxin [Bacilli bacterium]